MGNKHDAVHKPAHYTEGRKYEPKDVIRDWKLNFNIGSAVKYLSRAGRKDDIVQDLKKAQEFIQFEIDAIEAQRAKEPPMGHDFLNCKCVMQDPRDDKMDAMLYGMDPEELVEQVENPNVISLENLAEMKAKTFIEKYLSTGKVHELEIKAISKVYLIDTVEVSAGNVTEGLFANICVPMSVYIKIKDKNSTDKIELYLGR